MTADATAADGAPDDSPGVASLLRLDSQRTLLGDSALTHRQHREGDVLWVSADETPNAIVNRFRSSRVDLPDRLDLLSLDDVMRSASAASGGVGTTTIPMQTTELTVHTLDGPSLRAIGTAIVDWQDDLDATTQPSVVVDDLAPLLEEFGAERIFRFLHVLCGSCRSAGVDLHVGIDMSDVTAIEFSTLAPLFDTVQS